MTWFHKIRFMLCCYVNTACQHLFTGRIGKKQCTTMLFVHYRAKLTHRNAAWMMRVVASNAVPTSHPSFSSSLIVSRPW